MGADELEKKIQKNIKSHLTHKDLLNLCTFLNIQVSGRKTYIQDKLLDHIKSLNYNTLLMMSSKIEEYIKASTIKPRQILNQKPMETGRYESSAFPMTNEKLTDNILKNAPVNLESEIPLYCRNELVVQPTLSYHSQVTNVPINERDMQGKLQNTLPFVQLSKSPFYCSSICLHPLSLLIPTHYPNIVQNNRNTNKFFFNFTLTENIKQIINKNQYLLNSKTEFKWQILLRFTAIDPNISLPNSSDKIPECIPPYLQVTVNGINQPLWEILPSNCRMKEGKRHAKPVQISDKLSDKTRTIHGSKQLVEISWWQTPAVYMYYYMGIYLERKLTVKEMMIPYVSNHMNNRTIEETLKMIQSKLGDASKNKRKDIEDDDLVISNVLPINLCCPVGKSRIEIPLRTISCQHLQCFDAHLFLSMNERRPVWKCPVCDNRASPNDLFCDKFFEKILLHFKNDDEVTDVNVHPDNSFVAVRRSKDRGDRSDKFDNSPNIESSTPCQVPTVPEQDLIVLDSDEESESVDSVTPPSINQKQTSVESDKSSRVVEDTDFRRSVTNKTTTSSVQINICTPDESSARVPSTITQQPDRLPGITNVLSSFNINGSPRLPNTPRQENVNNILLTPGPPTNSTAPTVTTTNSTVTTTDCLLPPPKYPTLRLDSPSSPSKFNSTIINSASLSTSSLFNPSVSSSTHIVSQNSTTSSLSTTIVSSVANSNKSNSTVATTRSNSKTPTYTPKNSTTSYADIVGPDKLQRGQMNVSKPDTPVISTPTIPNSMAASSQSNRSSSSKSIFDTNNYKKPSTSAPVPSGLKPKDSSPNKDSESGRETEIVKTLDANISPAVVRNRTGNHSPVLVECPNVVFTESNANKEPRPVNDDITNKFPTPAPVADKKSEQSVKKSKIFMSKIPPPPSAIVIPSVTIDLTDEDDETPQTTVPINLHKNKNPFGSKQINNNMKWVSVTAPISNALKTNPNGVSQMPNNINNNRFSFVDKNRDGAYRKSLDPGVDHYKPHQMKHSNNFRNQAIDLTGDDEEDECSQPKRFKSNLNFKAKLDTEDGEIDNESCSSNDPMMQIRHISKKNVASHM